MGRWSERLLPGGREQFVDFQEMPITGDPNQLMHQGNGGNPNIVLR